MLQNKVSACPKKAKERTKNLRSLLCAKLNFCLMLHVQMLYVLHEQSMCTERGKKWKCSHLFMLSPLDTKNRPLLLLHGPNVWSKCIRWTIVCQGERNMPIQSLGVYACWVIKCLGYVVGPQESFCLWDGESFCEFTEHVCTLPLSRWHFVLWMREPGFILCISRYVYTVNTSYI